MTKMRYFMSKDIALDGKTTYPKRVFYRLAVDSLNVINDAKYNKVLNVITFGPKCNKLFRSDNIRSKDRP